jgi:Ran-binding protein 9/10
MCKFFEDPDGGRDYCGNLSVHPGCVIGCGYAFNSGALFFTFNGERLPDAFRGIFMPQFAYDVYAAIGVDGSNDLEVNFGTKEFAWKDGNDWTWRVEGHVGQTISDSIPEETLPGYSIFA